MRGDHQGAQPEQIQETGEESQEEGYWRMKIFQ